MIAFGVDWNRATISDIDGIDVKARDDKGRTPLHMAAGYQNSEIVSTLLDAGADISTKDKGGNTPLHLAAWDTNNTEIISALLNAGADINAWSGAGLTPLHMAAFLNSSPEIILTLVNAGADVKVKGRGRTAYDFLQHNRELDTSAHQKLHDKLRKLCSKE